MVHELSLEREVTLLREEIARLRASPTFTNPEGEDILDQMFSDSPSFMTVLSVPHYRYMKSNEAHFRLIQKWDIIGKTVQEVLPEVVAQGFIKILDGVVETGRAFIGTEVPISFADHGGTRTEYIDLVYKTLRRSTGEIYAIAAHGNIVTEKVMTRKSVENERENFRNLFKQTPEMVCILGGENHVFEFVNEAHVKALGFNATGKTVREAQPESVEVHGILDEVYRTGKTAELHEIPVTVKDRVRYFNLTYSARRDDLRIINGIMILGIEVTEQKNASLMIETQRERFNRLAAASGIGVWYCDLPFSDLTWDEKVKEHFWLPADTTVTIDTFYERIHPEDRESTRLAIETSMQSHTRYETEFRTVQPGDKTQIKWIQAIGWTDYDSSGKPIRFDGITLDVTARRFSEQALRESEGRQKLLSQTMLQGVVQHRRDGSILSMNASAKRVLGMSSENMFNPLHGVPGHPNIREDGSLLPESEHPVMLAVKTGQPVSRQTLGIYNPEEKSYCWIEKDAVPLFRPGESIPYEVFAIFSDITQRKQSEEKLRESEAKFSHLVKSIPQLLWTTLADGKVCDYLSPQWAEYTGAVPPEQQKMQWVASVIHPEDLNRVWEHWSGAVRDEHNYDIEYRIRGRDGAYRWFKARATPVRNSDDVIL